jgi:hypothetical protein
MVLLAAVTYYITVDDGTYKDKDWSSTPYAAGEYVNNVSVNSDGTLSANIEAQELWDKMIENNGRVNLYLDNPEELARLMKAEIVTQYPDTRENPDEEIDWEDIIANADKLQGIIKFKRSDSNNKLSTMSYVDSDTFYGWLELYAQTGDETYKNKALTHFTLRQEVTSNNNKDTASDYTKSDIVVDCSEAIVNAAKQVASPGAGYCQAWVCRVYKAAGLGDVGYATAYDAFLSNCVSTSRDNIPVGATVYGTGSGSYAGHVGIYIGNGLVMDNVGEIKTSTLDEWISWQEANPTVISGVEPGWLGWGWQSGSPTIISIPDGTSENTTTSTTQNNTSSSTSTDETDITTSNSTSYVAVVATWKQIDTVVTTNDPNVTASSQTQYIMTTTNINYKEMVEKYSMPFDFLWALLVTGEDKDFVFELSDLVYNSDIQITVYDNLTVNTDVDEWNYTKRTKAVVNATITASCNGETATGSISNDVHDPHEENNYTTTKTVVTHTNTINAVLTRANVWIVDYQNNYTYVSPTTSANSTTVTKNDEEYSNSPDSTGTAYSCTHISSKESELKSSAIAKAKQKDQNTNSVTNKTYSASCSASINVKYYSKYVNISDNITNTIETQQYVEGTPTVKEKTDKDSEEPNFVTIFNKSEYSKNKSNINSADEWLFEILETNDSTSNMVDLMKYLLYMATGHKYSGIDSYDFSEYEASSFQSVSTGIYEGTLQEKVWFALKDLGYSDIVVAGAMGNIDFESGGFDASAVEKEGTGIGLVQWSFSRANQLKAYAESKGTSWTDEDTQIEFLVAEISGQGVAAKYATHRTAGYIGDEGITATYKDWSNATTIEDSTLYFMRYFESPAHKITYNQSGSWR